jgi:hypothetical protein
MLMKSNTSYQDTENLLLKAKICQLEKQLDEFRQAYENLHQQMQDLLRHRFGTRSERHPDATHPQLDFLMDNLSDTPKNQEEDAEQITKSKSSR